MIDFNETVAQLKTEKAGTQIIYHKGHLAYDKGVGSFDKKTPEQKEITAIGQLAYALYLEGRVSLTQRRQGPRRFDYIAIILPDNGKKDRALQNNELHNNVRCIFA